LKYQLDLSGDNVVAAGIENPYWQHLLIPYHSQERMMVGAASQFKMTPWPASPSTIARFESLGKAITVEIFQHKFVQIESSAIQYLSNWSDRVCSMGEYSESTFRKI
jgi:hypothetical protein